MTIGLPAKWAEFISTAWTLCKDRFSQVPADSKMDSWWFLNAMTFPYLNERESSMVSDFALHLIELMKNHTEKPPTRLTVDHPRKICEPWEATDHSITRYVHRALFHCLFTLNFKGSDHFVLCIIKFGSVQKSKEATGTQIVLVGYEQYRFTKITNI